ncbi:MAG: hemolysin family protein [Rhodospirillaceae bacterium]
MTLLIIYVSLALVVSFLCSISEAVLLSIRRSYVLTLKEENPKTATMLSGLLEELDRPLAAILSLNTIAHTVGAAGAGAQAAIVFGDAAVGVFSGVLTLLILVLSEIIPKTLGATHWRALAPVVGRSLVILIALLKPFIWLSELITSVITKGKASIAFTREEFAAMVDLGAKQGQLESHETNVFINIMKLDRLQVRDIMTPRLVMFSVPETDSVAAFTDAHATQPFSRIPVYADTPDEVTGFVLKNEVLTRFAQGDKDVALRDLVRPIPTVIETLSLSVLFETLIENRNHIALVVDEYGGVEGLVTLEDVVETVLGLEIVDEHDTVEDMRALARKKWRARAAALGIDPQSLQDTPQEDNVEKDDSEGSKAVQKPQKP